MRKKIELEKNQEAGDRQTNDLYLKYRSNLKRILTALEEERQCN